MCQKFKHFHVFRLHLEVFTSVYKENPGENNESYTIDYVLARDIS